MTRILALAAAALVAVPAAAQQQQLPQPGEAPAKLGLGAGFSASSVTPTIRVPLLVAMSQRAGYVRIEPYLQLLTTSTESFVGTTTTKTDGSTLELGASVVFATPVFPYAYGFGGGRLGLVRRVAARETSTPATTTQLDDSGVGLVLAAIVGGDVFLHPRLSLGAEVGLGYMSTPKLEDGTPSTMLQAKSSQVFTDAQVVLRFWFK